MSGEKLSLTKKFGARAEGKLRRLQHQTCATGSGLRILRQGTDWRKQPEDAMAWLIIAEDQSGAAALRQDKALMARMWEWELSQRDRILAAGSLRTDDGGTPVGSLMVLDVASRAEAEAIWASDPATQAGLRQPPQIRYWNPAILNREVMP
jgi:hypothetical protein